MGCLISVLGFVGPRLAVGLWWILDQSWFNRLYETYIWPFLGFLFLPWTTLMYTIVATPAAGVSGWGWFWVGLGAVLDVATYGGSGYEIRNRVPWFSRPTSTTAP